MYLFLHVCSTNFIYRHDLKVQSCGGVWFQILGFKIHGVGVCVLRGATRFVVQAFAGGVR